jgi:hypothetical protein
VLSALNAIDRLISDAGLVNRDGAMHGVLDRGERLLSGVENTNVSLERHMQREAKGWNLEGYDRVIRC